MGYLFVLIGIIFCFVVWRTKPPTTLVGICKSLCITMIVTVILAIIAAGVLLAIWGVQEYTYSQNAKLDELYSQASPAVRERIDIEADNHVRESKRYKSESRNEVRGNPLIDDLILFSNPRHYIYADIRYKYIRKNIKRVIREVGGESGNGG